MHANAVAEEAMKLFDNLMKHEVDLANVESENVKHITDIDPEMLLQEEKIAAGLMAITLFVTE